MLQRRVKSVVRTFLADATISAEKVGQIAYMHACKS